MKSIGKIKAAYSVGGVKYIQALIKDKLLKTSTAPKLFYSISMNAKPDQYARILENYYYISTSKRLDLNNPLTLSEKIQWLKLFDNSPLKTRLCDKYLAREWIAERVGEEHLVPLLGVWKSFDEICFDQLPNSFVLKTNHGSGTNIIVDDATHFDKKKSKELIEQWMKINFAYVHGFEMQYKDVPVRIIAEQFMTGFQNDGICDYRFFCFHGEPEQVWVDKYSGTAKHIRSIYNMKWEKQDISCVWPDGGKELSEKPKTFDLMIDFARRLSQDFLFVRVDFYEIDGHIYVGELTFTPMSGMGEIRPESADYELGRMLNLPLQKE